MTNRLHLIVADDTKANLNAIKENNAFNTTVAVSKGVALLKYILDAQNRGASIKVTEKDGTSRYVEVMF
jgi:hypothetical protein